MIAVPAALLALVAVSQAHTVGWAKGMYCLGGNVAGKDDQNTNTAVNPLYELSFEDFWFQHDRGCDLIPPAEGDILELPAGGQVTLEMAHNRAQTSLSFNGEYAGEWPDGRDHPQDWNGNGVGDGCIQGDGGALHTKNESTAAGTALAISYESDLSAVTLDNLVVFSVLEKTPWKRIGVYDIPADLPACPPGGCTCAWLWVPDGCGIPNVYMAGYKCNVTGATSTAPVGTAKPPTYCADDSSKCQAGPKQMIIWNQAEANNVQVPSGQSPGYNTKNGWAHGAQNDIFVSQSVTKPVVTTSIAASATATAPAVASSTAPASCAATPARRRPRRALGRFVEAIADKLESYDL